MSKGDPGFGIGAHIDELVAAVPGLGAGLHLWGAIWNEGGGGGGGDDANICTDRPGSTKITI